MLRQELIVWWPEKGKKWLIGKDQAEPVAEFIAVGAPGSDEHSFVEDLGEEDNVMEEVEAVEAPQDEGAIALEAIQELENRNKMQAEGQKLMAA